jgi:hypothetical protein
VTAVNGMLNKDTGKRPFMRLIGQRVFVKRFYGDQKKTVEKIHGTYNKNALQAEQFWYEKARENLIEKPSQDQHRNANSQANKNGNPF